MNPENIFFRFIKTKWVTRNKLPIRGLHWLFSFVSSFVQNELASEFSYAMNNFIHLYAGWVMGILICFVCIWIDRFPRWDQKLKLLTEFKLIASDIVCALFSLIFFFCFVSAEI